MKHVSIVLMVCFSALIYSSCNNEETNAGGHADASAAASDIVSDWKLGPQMWAFRMFTFLEGLEKTDSVGLKSIEAFWGQPLGGGLKDSFGINMSADSRAKVKEWLQSKGISITAMGVIVPKSREEWVSAFELAKEFGLSYITTEPKKNQWDMIDSLADQYNIKLAIHDHPMPSAYWHPDSVLAAIQGRRHIGACADVGHWARSGLDPVECLKKLEGRIYGVHLKDIVSFGDLNAEDTVVSKGVINFPAIFTELKRQNFKGQFSIEQESNWYHNVPDMIFTAKYFKEEVEKLK